MRILAACEAPNTGLVRGSVEDSPSVRSAIEYALVEATAQAQCDCDAAYVVVAGTHITCATGTGYAPIRNSARGATFRDISDALNATSSENTPVDELILHAIPAGFSIDSGEPVKNPIRLPGELLTATTRIISGSAPPLMRTARAVNSASVDVTEMVFAPLACAEAALFEDEKESGVCLLDIGSGTAGIAVYHRSLLQVAASLPICGSHVTADISFGLAMGRDAAEDLKLLAGHCCADLVGEYEVVESPAGEYKPPRLIRRKAIAQIVEPRMEELFQHAKTILMDTGFFHWQDASVVITGGGAKITGCAYLASQYFGVPARVGGPGKLPGLPNAFTGPEYSAAVGLAQYAAKHTAIEISTTGGDDPLRAFYEQVVEMVKRRIGRTE